MATRSKTVATVNKIEVYAKAWAVLELLEPDWLMLDKRFCHHLTWQGLERKGWIEVRVRTDYLMVRLIPVGRAVRDEIHKRRAKAADRKQRGDR